MITIIIGDPGVGKTALMAHFATQYMIYDPDIELCKQKIATYNSMGYNLSVPQHLVFTDFKVTTSALGIDLESYFINGYYVGMPNAQHPTQFLPPFSKLFKSEGQRYYDSRNYDKFSWFISQFFEQHRHYGLMIFIDCQRLGLIDKNIRDIATKIILVQSMVNDIDSYGHVLANHWQCREFPNSRLAEMYLERQDDSIGTPVEYTHDNSKLIQFPKPTFRDSPQFRQANYRLIKGKQSIRIPVNIFDNYNSTNKEFAFLRGRKGHDFSLCKHPTDDMYINELDDIYSFECPDTYYKLPAKELAKIPKGRVLTI